jgi:tetratricopeptide (TPR) repeat protein
MLSIAERIQSWAFALHDEGAAEVDLLGQMVLDQAGVTAEVATPLFIIALAEALIFHGRDAESLAVVEVGLKAVQRQRVAMGVIELHRLRGELLFRLGHDLQAAEDELEAALMLAQTQGVKLYALRAVTSLCRVWAQRGRSAEAIVRLQEALAGFPATSSLWDIQAARSLLHELSTAQR